MYGLCSGIEQKNLYRPALGTTKLPSTWDWPLTDMLKFNAAEWATRLRKLSDEFTKFPGTLNSNVVMEAQRVSRTTVTRIWPG